MKKVVITGGAGFIGSNLAEYLCREGYEVHIIDNLSTGRIENLDGFRDKVTFHKMDINDSSIVDVMKGTDTVFHQAAIPSVPRSVSEPAVSNHANIDGTLNVLLAARDADVRRVVFASSSSVYGDTPTLPKKEDMFPSPLSPYAISKLTGEYYCRVFYSLYGLETVCLRYFNIFGPRQNPESQYAAAIPKFIKAIREGTPPTIFGDGEQTRDFTFVENVVSANVLAMNAPAAPGTVANIGCGTRISVNRLVAIIKEIIGSEIEPQYLDPRPGDVKHSLADISVARDKLGFQPLVSIENGLARTCEYFKNSL